MFDLLVIGEINPDLVLTGRDVVPEFGQAEKLVDTSSLTVGSSAAITACGAARLGLSVAFIGLAGDDLFGRFMLQAMQERGIDVSACVINPVVPTGISVILSRPEDRAILTHAGTMPLLRIEQIDESLLSKARHLHVSSYFLLDELRPELPGLFARAKELGLTTSLDTNWDPTEQWHTASIMPYVDLFLPNEQEVLFIGGEQSFPASVDALAQRVPILAVKLGAKGGLARQKDRIVRWPALPVEVVDTTGAGDSFNAGFLFGYLNDYTLDKSLALACACGSLSTRASGGTTAQPHLDEALTAVRQYEDLTP